MGTSNNKEFILDESGPRYGINGTYYNIWHAGNSNKKDVAWACSTLLVGNSTTQAGVLKTVGTDSSNSTYNIIVLNHSGTEIFSVKNGGALYASGAASLNSTLSVAGNTTLSGTLTVGTASVNKATTLYGTLSVTDNITLANAKYLKVKSAGNVAFEAVGMNAAGAIKFGSVNADCDFRGNSLRFSYGANETVAIRVFTTGKLGINTTTASTYQVEIAGDLHATTGIACDSYITAGTTNSSSDARLKDNITSVKNALDTIMSLKPSEWVWNEKHFLNGEKGAGLIAQDVEKVLPFAVSKNGDYLALNYNVFHAYEIATIQYLVKRVKELEAKLGGDCGHAKDGCAGEHCKDCEYRNEC